MHKRGLCRHAVSVRLSVRPSVTFVDSVETINIFSIFSQSGSHTILVFFYTKRHGNIPMETPLTGTLNAGGIGKNRDFRPVSVFIACCQRCDRLGVINTAPPDLGNTLIVGIGSKRRSLLMADYEDEMFTQSQRYAKDNSTAFNCTQ